MIMSLPPRLSTPVFLRCQGGWVAEGGWLVVWWFSGWGKTSTITPVSDVYMS